jgi:hypothetical protein
MLHMFAFTVRLYSRVVVEVPTGTAHVRIVQDSDDDALGVLVTVNGDVDMVGRCKLKPAAPVIKLSACLVFSFYVHRAPRRQTKKNNTAL